MTAEDIIQILDLIPLPDEGGFFRETHRAGGMIPAAALPDHSGDRNYGTVIYYLVTPSEFSALHRVCASDEIFHFYLGDPVDMIQITEDGRLAQFVLGPHIPDQQVQMVVPKNVWQGTRLKAGGSWALLGCSVYPGFDFADLEVAHRKALQKQFPQHASLIERFTRPTNE